MYFEIRCRHTVHYDLEKRWNLRESLCFQMLLPIFGNGVHHCTIFSIYRVLWDDVNYVQNSRNKWRCVIIMICMSSGNLCSYVLLKWDLGWGSVFLGKWRHQKEDSWYLCMRLFNLGYFDVSVKIAVLYSSTPTNYNTLILQLTKRWQNFNTQLQQYTQITTP